MITYTFDTGPRLQQRENCRRRSHVSCVAGVWGVDGGSRAHEASLVADDHRSESQLICYLLYHYRTVQAAVAAPGFSDWGPLCLSIENAT